MNSRMVPCIKFSRTGTPFDQEMSFGVGPTAEPRYRKTFFADHPPTSGRNLSKMISPASLITSTLCVPRSS